MKISVIGADYVGLVTGTCLSEVGNRLRSDCDGGCKANLCPRNPAKLCELPVVWA
jgi:hypothetical protein